MHGAPVNDYRPIEVANLLGPSDVGLGTRTIGTVISMPYEVAGPLCHSCMSWVVHADFHRTSNSVSSRSVKKSG